ncbi:hypothetical protein Dsin_008343 [Dipteronia sinensis]|uniref:Uncharacterized protein n=1 Tax=Dipteronia sinensis TaxID=43782 RepID=A0AAE0EAK8_9ROSI|nr:hypothetical protein Dsin_008343 [Dipteronia sinensis]
MFGRYHILGGINDQSLKHVYVNSFPTELQEELQRRIDTSGRPFNDITLGEIHMFTLGALDKLCATQKIFSKMIREGKRYEAQCKQPSLHIKCKDKDQCFCKPKKKHHFRPFKSRSDSSSCLQVPIQILLTKFSKPIEVIAYFDTGSHTTMMNPNILPPDSWKPHTRYFKATDGKIFTTNLISKSKISIKFFPSFTIWIKVLASSASSSSSSSSSSFPPIKDYPLELLSQNFARSYLPIYLLQIKQQRLNHALSNPSRPFLDPFIMPPVYYFTPQALWYLWCLSILYHHALVFPFQATYALVHEPSPSSTLFLTFL